MKSFTKRSLAVLIAVLMVFSMMAIGITSSSALAAGETLYFTPYSGWKNDGARFAAYYYGAGDTWTDFTAVEGETNLYSTTIPEGGYTHVIFIRMNPSSTANNWNNKWNQSGNVELAKATGNCAKQPSNKWDDWQPTWTDFDPEVETTAAPTTAPNTDPKTVYFVNSENWEIVNAHMWTPDVNGTNWPGEAMTKTDAVDPNGNSVYSITFTDNYQMIIFNNKVGDAGVQTGDLEMLVGKYYNYADGTWYATLEEIPVAETTTPAPKTYTVAGTENLCGEGWNPANADNDLTDEDGDGIFTKVYENLAAGDYQFKVVEDHSWDTPNYGDPNGPDGNVVFTVYVTATLTVNFDANTNTFSYKLEGDTPAESEDPSDNTEPSEDETIFTDEYVYFVGDWENVNAYAWTEGKGENATWPGEAMTKADDGNYYSIKVSTKFNNIIFNSGAKQTGDLGINFGQYYNLADNTWYTSLDEIPEPTAPAPKEYTLFGFIDGANKACEDDADSVYPELTFVDGKATVTFAEDSWVGVKTTDNTTRYWTEGYAGEVDTVTLYVNPTVSDKLYVPAGKVEFTLVVNEDGTLTLSYTVLEKPTEDTTPTVDTTPSDPVEVEYMNIYFQNNWLWKDINVHYWGSAAGGTEWPGAPMEFYDNDGEYDYYVAKVPTDVEGFLINGTKNEGGTDQTPNIEADWYDGICYSMTWNDGNQVVSDSLDNMFKTEEPTEDTTPTVDTTPSDPVEVEYMNIYFQNNWLWKDINVHYWGSAAGGTEWPGAPMEFYDNDGEYDYYVAKVPTDVEGFLINGTKNEGGTDQTPNIEADWYDGICYAMTWNDGNQVVSDSLDNMFKTEEPTEDTTPTVDTTPSDPVEVEYMNIYFQNNWLWKDINVHYWGSAAGGTEWPGASMEFYDNDGEYDYYVAKVPTDVDGFLINGTKNEGGTDQTPNIEADWYDGICYAMTWNDGNQVVSDSLDNMFKTEEPTEDTTPSQPEEVKNGIVEEDGELYYYVDGTKTYAGLIIIDGNFYYVNSSCKVITGKYYYISKNNGLIACATYEFDADGKMVNPPELESDDVFEEGEVKNGFVREDGVTYYYVEGVKTYAGLIKIDGAYYYVNSACQVIRNQSYYISKTNDLLPTGGYAFDFDGKMINPPAVPEDDVFEEGEVKNGFVREGGKLYYYVDGEKNYAGLINIDGKYYYVNSSCIVITGKAYYISKTNGLCDPQSFQFDTNGVITNYPG